jgi:hypothetical protein
VNATSTPDKDYNDYIIGTASPDERAPAAVHGRWSSTRASNAFNSQIALCRVSASSFGMSSPTRPTEHAATTLIMGMHTVSKTIS